MFKKAVAVSFIGHILFFSSVYFTFKAQSNEDDASSVSFFGSVLGKNDFDLRPVIKKVNIAATKFRTIYRRQEQKSDLASIQLSFLKPLYPVKEVSDYQKHLNKFLVTERSVGAQDKVTQKPIELPKWERVDLRLKPE